MALQKFLYINISAYSDDCQLRYKKEVLEIIHREVARATADPTDVLVLPWCVFIGGDIELIQDLPTLSADSYNGKLSRGPNFRDFRDDQHAKIRTAKYETAKI